MKMKSRATKILLLPSFILVSALAVFWYVSSREYSIYGNEIEKISVENAVFYAEIVADKKTREEGLSGRKSLCKSCAMLFLFDKPEKYGFWMKGMNFPIDIIWIHEKRIVHIEKNVPYESLEIFVPESAADMVLEINAGLSDKFGIKKGDRINIKISD
jgi:hypothetical protein